MKSLIGFLSLNNFYRYLSFSVILALTFTLLSTIHPVQAEANEEINLDSVNKNIDLSIKEKDIGKTEYLKVTVDFKDIVLPKEFNSFDGFYRMYLFNTQTGEILGDKGVSHDSEYFDDESPFAGDRYVIYEDQIDIDVDKFIGNGTTKIQVVLAPAGIFTNVNQISEEIFLGKSNSLEVYRSKDISIELTQTRISSYDNTFSYKLNQYVNGNNYRPQLLNINTGLFEDIFMYSNFDYRIPIEDEVNFERHTFGKKNDYVVLLVNQAPYYDTSNDSIGYEQQKALTEDLDIVAKSKTLSLFRGKWSLEYGFSEDSKGEFFQFWFPSLGTGRFVVYVADKNNGEILWNSYNKKYDSDFEQFENIYGLNFTEDDVNIYIAANYEYFEGEEPTNINQLEEIVYSTTGVRDKSPNYVYNDEVSGGINPNRPCNFTCHGDPISTFNGEFFEKKEDIKSLSENGLNFERTYSIMRRKNKGSLGLGWSNNYDMKMLSANLIEDIYSDEYENFDDSFRDSEKIIKISNENGSFEYFERLEDGAYTSSNENNQTSLELINGEYVYTRHKLNNKLIFDNSGLLLRIETPKHTTLIERDSSDRITKITRNNEEISISYYLTNAKKGLIETVSLNGKESKYFYNNKGRLTSLTDENNIEYIYTYDTDDKIKTFRNELGGIFTNTYDTNDRVIRQKDPLGNITKFSYNGDDPLETIETTITYPNGLKVIEEYHYGNLTKSSEISGNTNIETTYSYDEEFRLIETIDSLGNSKKFEYDERDNKTKEIDSLGNSISFEYDSDNNLTKVTDPYGNETLNTYNNKKNLLSTTDPLGNKTTFTYDNNSNLTSVTDARGNKSNANPSDYTSTLSYTNKGQLSNKTDSLGNTLNFEYNSKGELVKTTDSKNNETLSQYGALGLPTKVIDPLLNETALTYDNMGNVLTSENALGAKTTYTYDLFGNMLTSTNSLNEVTTYEYNKMNKVTKITLPSGATQQITYDNFSRPIQFIDESGFINNQSYNKAGQIITSTDEENKVTKYSYNGNGDIYSITNPDGGVTYYEYDKNKNVSKITDPLERITEYTYNANNQLIEEKKPDGTLTKTFYDEVGNIVKTVNEDNKEKNYTFDSLNRQTSYVNENNQTVTYEYDKNSNLTKQTRTDGSIVNYEYDARDLLIKIDYPGTDSDITYTYDAIGRKTSEKKGSQSPKNFTYDSLNRIIEQGESNSEVSYEYDNAGNLSEITYPSGRTVDYSYNAKGDLTNLTSGSEISSDFIYNKRGQETQASIINGIIENSTYDNNARSNSMDILDSNLQSLYKRTHKFNQADEVIERGTSVSGSTLNTDKFSYDANSRLTGQNKSSDDSSVNSYNYGNSGTLKEINGKAQVFDDAGRITNSGDSSISYDSRNNRVSVIDSADSSSNVNYEWAVDNLLKKIELGDTNLDIIEYEYDSSGLLKSRIENSNTDDFVWDLNREIPALLSDGEFEYIYKDADRAPFAQVNLDTNKVEFLHSDLNGSILAATDETGALVDTVEYSPYGESSDDPVSNFGYAGEWVDPSTGYSYNKARWYDISTGSFLSEDPLVQLTLNAFGYTEGNPLTQIDPLGLFSFSETYNKTLDNSAWISLGLLTVGTVASFIPGGASLGIPLAFAGSILSGLAAERNFRNKKYADAAIDVIGIIPGLASIKYSKKLTSLSEAIEIRKSKNLIGKTGLRQKRNRLNGKDKIEIQRYESLLYKLDLIDSGLVGFGVGREMTTSKEKANNECK